MSLCLSMGRTGRRVFNTCNTTFIMRFPKTKQSRHKGRQQLLQVTKLMIARQSESSTAFPYVYVYVTYVHTCTRSPCIHNNYYKLKEVIKQTWKVPINVEINSV